MKKHKIINDPVYGFITIKDALIFDIIEHPYYQRLRRISQMAMAQLVYPGATHTRLHHSLGAYHLMCNAVNELRNKNVEITTEEEVAVKAAILLHDIGHGPFSHALEFTLFTNVHHEEISLLIMQKMNREMNGALDLAIKIFKGEYHKTFLTQLISGQLDVDRMDYLTRDSFYSGVSEGVIGYDRILKMLAVHNNELVIEEKGIYSVEKFLIARRQMYWQVYLHKTVLAAEKMLVNILQRVRELHSAGDKNLHTLSLIDWVINEFDGTMDDEALDKFTKLDDHDVMHAVKVWASHSDTILSLLCNRLLDRKLYKVKLQTTAFEEDFICKKQEAVIAKYGISKAELKYFCFSGESVNTLYHSKDENINILYKDGTIKDISLVDNALINHNISTQVKKTYLCYLE